MVPRLAVRGVASSCGTGANEMRFHPAPWILAIVLLAFRGPEEARAQRPVGDEVDQKSWAGLVTGGYSAAIGDAFGGGSSVGFTAGLYRIRSPTFSLGFEAGYDRFESNWSVLRAAVVGRFHPARSSIRPVGIIGFGAYMVRTRRLITQSSTRPGVSAGLGVELPQALGGLTVGAEARWHGLVNFGLQMVNFATIAISVGFD